MATANVKAKTGCGKAAPRKARVGPPEELLSAYWRLSVGRALLVFRHRGTGTVRRVERPASTWPEMNAMLLGLIEPQRYAYTTQLSSTPQGLAYMAFCFRMDQLLGVATARKDVSDDALHVVVTQHDIPRVVDVVMSRSAVTMAAYINTACVQRCLADPARAFAAETAADGIAKICGDGIDETRPAFKACLAAFGSALAYACRDGPAPDAIEKALDCHIAELQAGTEAAALLSVRLAAVNLVGAVALGHPVSRDCIARFHELIPAENRAEMLETMLQLQTAAGQRSG
jgi:hypothetical protein